MQESRRQLYLKLVQQLLNCKSDRESEILAANGELLDEGFVTTMLAVAQELDENVQSEGVGTIVWLRSFTRDLVQELGLSNVINDPKTQFKFLMNVLQAVSDSGGDSQVIYPMLRQKLGLLDEVLIFLLSS